MWALRLTNVFGVFSGYNFTSEMILVLVFWDLNLGTMNFQKEGCGFKCLYLLIPVDKNKHGLPSI